MLRTGIRRIKDSWSFCRSQRITMTMMKSCWRNMRYLTCFSQISSGKNLSSITLSHIFKKITPSSLPRTNSIFNRHMQLTSKSITQSLGSSLKHRTEYIFITPPPLFIVGFWIDSFIKVRYLCHEIVNSICISINQIDRGRIYFLKMNQSILDARLIIVCFIQTFTCCFWFPPRINRRFF